MEMSEKEVKLWLMSHARGGLLPNLEAGLAQPLSACDLINLIIKRQRRPTKTGFNVCRFTVLNIYINYI